ncbi:hypothetical protein [Streptosporangium sandarakinum]
MIGAGVWLTTSNTPRPGALAADPSSAPPDADWGSASSPASTSPSASVSSPSPSVPASSPEPDAPSPSGTPEKPEKPEKNDKPGKAGTKPAVPPSTAPKTDAGEERETRAVVPPPPVSSPSPADSSAKGGSAQLTAKQAYRIHSDYQRGLSAAQRDLDQAAMGKLEGGLAVQMTRAGFKTAEMEGGSVAAGIWPNPRVWIPRHVTGRPDWFVAVSTKPGVGRVADLMSSTPDGWRLVASAADTRPTPDRFPVIATDDDGYATSLSENATGLVATPRQVVDAHLASMERAEVDPMFADGPWTSDIALFWQEERAQLEDAGWSLTLSYLPEGPVRALRTADGGALVWYGARSTDTRKVERPGARVALKGAAAVRTGNRSFAHSARASYGRMYVTYIPPAGSPDPVRVLGDWSEVLESHGD